MITTLDVIAHALVIAGFVLMVFGNATDFLSGFAMCAVGVGAACWRDEA
jgi:hypothetical protein